MSDHKTLYIGGGIAASVLLVILAIKKKSAASAATSQDGDPVSVPTTTQDLGYFSGSIPQSIGYVSANSTPTDPANSGSTASAGGFDITSLLGSVLKDQATSNAASVSANSQVTDSAILAGINLGYGNGIATVSHSADGTTLSVAREIPIVPPQTAPIAPSLPSYMSAPVPLTRSATTGGQITPPTAIMATPPTPVYTPPAPAPSPVYSAPTPTYYPATGAITTYGARAMER